MRIDQARTRWLTTLSAITAACMLAVTTAHPLAAQGSGTVRGTVTLASDGSPIANASVSISGTSLRTLTNRAGQYTLSGVPVGAHTLLVRRLGFRVREVSVQITAGTTQVVNVSFEPAPIPIGEVVVTAVSRQPERVVDAPSAVSVVEPAVARDVSITGQAARAFSGLPGVDVAQSGMFDYNVNARGLNSSLSRRVLVLQDGRDAAFTFLGTPAWGFQTNGVDDMQSIEMVRGPGSALYGANAYNGVVSFTTSSPRDAPGTRINVAGGELTTFRASLRHSGVTPGGTIGYKVSGGYYRSESWSRSRTTGDGGDLEREYRPVTAQPVDPVIEALPLAGQTLDPTTRAALGDPDPIVGIFGTGRLDYYSGNSVGTVEGGVAHLTNDVFVTGIGRVQLDNLLRPWARIAWNAPRFNIMAWYNGEDSSDPARSLGAGIPIDIHASSIHAEAQFNTPIANGQGRIVGGASAQNSWVDTRGTLLAAELDDRSDQDYSVFGQFEWDLAPQVRLVGAARVDEGSLYEPQFSPKGAIVLSPAEDHNVRFTVNRAFQTAAQTEYFAFLPAAAPVDFSGLEAGLRASPLGAALVGVPDGELFTTSAAVPVLALGNEDLEVETITSYEVGYKGRFADRLYLTADVHFSRYKNFVTDLLPGVNPTFGAWTAPAAVPDGFKSTLEDAVRDQLLAAGQPLAAAGLSRLQDGSTAVVVSYTNAGTVDEIGVEFGAGVAVTDELRLDGNFTLFDFDVDQATVAPGDELTPNSPEMRVNASASYQGPQGFDARIRAEFVEGYDWAAGTFVGRVPAREIVDATVGYQANNYVRFQVTATNLFDQAHYMLFGGSVIGRRVLGGVTASF